MAFLLFCPYVNSDFGSLLTSPYALIEGPFAQGKSDFVEPVFRSADNVLCSLTPGCMRVISGGPQGGQALWLFLFV